METEARICELTCPSVTEEVKDKAKNGNKTDHLKAHLFKPKFDPYLIDWSPVP